MHAFITGATGFLGKHITQQLLEQGWQVTALCRDPQKIQDYPFKGVHFQQGNLQDIDSLRAAIVHGTDAIFHVAGDTSTWGPHHQQQYLNNVVGTQNLAKVAMEKRVTRFIQTSSLGVFGIQKEEISETSPMLGKDAKVAYYRSKFAADEVIREFIEKGLDAVFLNPAVVLGPYDSHNWIQLFDTIQNDELMGVPPGIKPFCYAGDVAAAHINAFSNGRCGESYLLAGPTGSFLSVSQWIAKRLDKPLPTKIMPAWQLKNIAALLTFVSFFTRKEPTISSEKARMICSQIYVNDKKAKTELHYKNDRTIDEMLELTYQWWKQK